MKPILIVLYILLSTYCIGQLDYYPNTSNPDNTLSFKTCPYDNSKMIWMYDGFEVFHTQNNLPDGPVDSNYCIGFGKKGSGQHYFVDGTQASTDKPLFISWKPTENTKGRQLLKHDLVELETQINSSLVDHFDSSSQCSFGKCLGIKHEIQKQVSNDSIRIETINTLIDYSSAPPYNSYVSLNSGCFMTEKFEGSHYKSFTMSIKLKVADTFRLTNYLSSFENEISRPDTSNLNDVMVDSNTYYFGDFMGSYYQPNFLFEHYIDSIPSPNNIALYEFGPIPNTDSSSVVNIQFSEYSSVHFEPFVQFLGSLPNIDTNRHTLNIINDNADYCLYNFIELVFQPQTHFIHKKGGIYPEGKACIMFNSGSSLQIEEGSDLYYGTDGQGMLAIKPKSSIILKDNSTLSISSNLILLDDNTFKQDTYSIEVPIGAKIEFRPNSSINTQFCSNPTTHVELLVTGGEVDLSGLDATSRKNIRVVYDTENPDKNQPISVVANPVFDKVDLIYNPSNYSNGFVNVYSLFGNLVKKQVIPNLDISNRISIDLSDISPGVYFIALDNQGTSNGVKVLKL